MIRVLATSFGLMSLLVVSASAQETRAEAAADVLFLAHPDSMPGATLDRVAWLEGHWQGSIFGAEAELVWAPAIGGSMMGMFKLIPDESVSFYEFFVLVEENGSLVLRLKHFHPTLEGWENREDMEVFPLVKLTATTAYFDGLTYRRVDADTLKGFLVVEDSEGVRQVDFTYRRTPVLAPPDGR